MARADARWPTEAQNTRSPIGGAGRYRAAGTNGANICFCAADG